MRFQRKATTVEAEQFTDETRPPAGVRFSDSLGFYVTTAQGRNVCVEIGEWIVREQDGERYYPVADDVFKDVYEPASTMAQDHYVQNRNADLEAEAVADKARIAELEAAIRDLKREHEASVPDYGLRRLLRDRLFNLVQ